MGQWYQRRSTWGLSYIQLDYRHIKIVRKFQNAKGIRTDQASHPQQGTGRAGAKKDEKLSRPEVVKRIWAYLKENKLQDPDNKQFFTPDAKMEPVFGKEKVRAFGMAKHLKPHLTN